MGCSSAQKAMLAMRQAQGTQQRWELTAPLGGVAQLQVVAGARRVFPGAVGAAHGLDLAAQGLERGVDSWVCLVVVIRGCFIFSELWQGICHGIVVVSHDVTNGSSEVARGPWRARRTRLTWWALRFKTKRQQRSSRVNAMPNDSKACHQKNKTT